VNNDIQDNNWSGIDTLSSSPTIRTNNITSNNLSGIRIYGSGTGTIVIRDNEVTYNLEHGIECESTSPVIRTNNITNNTMNGLRLNNSSPTIYDNNLIMYNQENGVACYSGSAPTITNDIRYNILNGIYSNASSPTVANALITNNSADGVLAEAGSSPNIQNSTIAGNTGVAFRIDGNSHPIALNSTFDETSVFFVDSGSTFTVQWFLHIKTIDTNNALLSYVDIWVDSTTQIPSRIWTGQTSFNGLAQWKHITEYIKTDNNGDNDGEDPGELTTWTPHNITADKFGYRLTYVDPEPTLDHTQWVTIKLTKNSAPGPATNIKPDTTHSLNPTLTWDPSIDPEALPITYWMNIGTWPNGTNIIFNQSTTYTNITLSFIPDDYGPEGNTTYYILLFADDQDGGFSKVNDQFYLVNHAPTQPGINITPRNPSTLINSLTCHINTSSIDLDGDEINYTYRWYKNGVLQTSLQELETKSLSDTISILTDGITFNQNDVWMCRVTANDGFVTSSRDEDSVKFINLMPIANPIKELVMDEDSEETDWINVSNVFEDPDPPVEGTSFKFWVSGNINISVKIELDGTVDIKPDPDWNGQETIMFHANDTGGATAQVSIEAVITVLPVNDEPLLLSVRNKLIEDSKILSFMD
ncbi:MAG: right-handed parallel beta-helix repeat-containing protein, partial [Thermoplasmata archaeon]|nr:right-handed parallel beta-helix repeat-containing protein [Thermoplasmata archaeon]